MTTYDDESAYDAINPTALYGWLQRRASDEQGTQGVLVMREGPTRVKFTTIELPEPPVPAATYFVTPYASPKHGNCFLLNHVPGHSMIEIHWGNYAGQEPQWKSDSKGCIILGNDFGFGIPVGFRREQKMVKNSRIALHDLNNLVAGRNWYLTIKDAA